MHARSLSILLVFLATACASPQRLTGRAVNCATRDVNIVPSVFSRKGMETAWCATCRDKLYRCATNVERSRISCMESREGDGCQ